MRFITEASRKYKKSTKKGISSFVPKMPNVLTVQEAAKLDRKRARRK